MPETLVLSSSSLAAFKRCRAKFKYAYEMLLKPKERVEAMEQGTAFHLMMARANNCLLEYWPQDQNFVEKYYPIFNADPMWLVALTYWEHEPKDYKPLLIEEPMYIKLDPDTWLRYTPDLVFKRRDFIVARDYKTFAKQPNIDVDLDFQGRIYTAALMRHFKTSDVWFEYECVRRTPPGVSHNAKGDKWSPDECYTRVPLVISKQEAEQLWEETREVAADIRRTRERGGAAWYRVDSKGWDGCTSCSMRFACKAEAQTGRLDQQTIALSYDAGKPLVLPEGLET